MLRWIATAIVLLIAGGGAYYYFHYDPLQAELNRRWPPITVEQQRSAAIDSMATVLKTLVMPNVAAGADVNFRRELTQDFHRELTRVNDGFRVRGSSSSGFLLVGLGGFCRAVFEAEAVVAGLEDVATMGEAVE